VTYRIIYKTKIQKEKNQRYEAIAYSNSVPEILEIMFPFKNIPRSETYS
jgi:hypothetical protein